MALLGAFVLVTGGMSAAGPVRTLSIDDLAAQADVVASGTILSVERGAATSLGPAVAHIWTAVLQPDRVLKGQVGPTVAFQFAMPDVPTPGYGGVAGHEYALFFLRSARGALTVVDDSQPSILVSRSAAATGDVLLDRISSLVGGVLGDPGSTANDKRDALLTLGRIHSPSADRALERALNDHDAAVQFRAAALLLDHNDLEGLPFAENALLHPNGTPDAYLSWLRAAIGADLSDSAAVPALASILTSPNSETRVAAAKALRHTESPGAVPALALALRDEDAAVEYWAVVGLEVAAGQGGAMSQEYFNAHRDELVGHWTAWARARGLIK